MATDTYTPPKNPDGTPLWDELDEPGRLCLCVCNAVTAVLESRGFDPFEVPPRVVDIDDGKNVEQTRLTVSARYLQPESGPGWQRARIEITARATRHRNTQCDEKQCGAAGHVCGIEDVERTGKREREALRQLLAGAVQAGCGGACSAVELHDIRKYNSGVFGGHIARLRMTV